MKLSDIIYLFEMKPPLWKVPAAPGSQPIPADHVRLYHQTHKPKLSNIRRSGIQPGQPVEGPRGIYADTRGFYGDPRYTPSVEFHVHKDEWRPPFVHRDQVERDKILATHKDWHETVRYIDADPQLRKEVEDGLHDDLMKPGKSDKFAKAVRFVKKRKASQQNIQESTSQIDFLIQYPLAITQMNSIDPEYWKNTKFKKSLIKLLLYKMQSHGNFTRISAVYLYFQLRDLKCPWPELDVIKKQLIGLNIMTPQTLTRHARDDKHRRWPDAEPIIMADPEWAYNYAHDVINNRWYDAEPVIMTDPQIAYYYAMDVIQNRWPEAEPTIMTDPQAAFYYARDVLRTKWPQAEPTIMTNPKWAEKYKEFFEKNIINENADQIQKLVNYPNDIKIMKHIDPAVWSNTQVKKSLMRYLLEKIQSDDVEYELDGAYVFDLIKNNGCTWPELSVLEPHVKNIVDQTEPRRLYEHCYYDLLKNRWPRAESIIMKDPRIALFYAADMIEGPWPEAEATIMTDPQIAYRYATTILEQPWPEAESVIMTDEWAAHNYRVFVNNYKKQRQSISESSDQIEQLKRNPQILTQMDSIDPAVWNDSQIKKSVIKYLLEGLQMERDKILGSNARRGYVIAEGLMTSAWIFSELKRLGCTWPELAVLEPHVNEVLDRCEPIELYRYALNVVKRSGKARWEIAEPYIIKDAKSAFDYAHDVLDKKPWPAAEPTIMKEPIWAYWYADKILKRPWPEAEPYIIKDLEVAFAYAVDILKRPWPEAEPLIMTHSMLGPDYKQFVDEFNKKKKKSKSNKIVEASEKVTRQILKVIDNPYLIDYIQLDPEIWRETGFKKAVIKWLLEKIEDNSMSSTVIYFKLKKQKCPWPELDIIHQHLIDNKLLDPERLYDYAVYNIGARWPEAEHYIMKNPQWAFEYITYFIGERWPEAEPYIATDPQYAYRYAINFMTDFNNPSQPTERWTLAEPVIKTDPFWATKYAFYIIGDRWPEAEATIMSDPETAKEYTTFVNSLNQN